MKVVTAIIRKGEKYYVGECVEIDVVTQGKTIEETINNLKEAISLYFEGEEIEIPYTDEVPIILPITVK